MQSMLINIYRSPLKDEMYLYVAKADLLEKVPEQLLTLFGKPYFVTTMLLKVDKKLARAKAEDVYSSLIEKGYYLQMPPPMSNEMRALADKNSKLSRI